MAVSGVFHVLLAPLGMLQEAKGNRPPELFSPLNILDFAQSVQGKEKQEGEKERGVSTRNTRVSQVTGARARGELPCQPQEIPEQAGVRAAPVLR